MTSQVLHMQACSPHYIFVYFIRLGYVGWASLGGIVLAITDEYSASHALRTSFEILVMS